MPRIVVRSPTTGLGWCTWYRSICRTPRRCALATAALLHDRPRSAAPGTPWTRPPRRPSRRRRAARRPGCARCGRTRRSRRCRRPSPRARGPGPRSGRPRRRRRSRRNPTRGSRTARCPGRSRSTASRCRARGSAWLQSYPAAGRPGPRPAEPLDLGGRGQDAGRVQLHRVAGHVPAGRQQRPGLGVEVVDRGHQLGPGRGQLRTGRRRARPRPPAARSGTARPRPGAPGPAPARRRCRGPC